MAPLPPPTVPLLLLLMVGMTTSLPNMPRTNILYSPYNSEGLDPRPEESRFWYRNYDSNNNNYNNNNMNRDRNYGTDYRPFRNNNNNNNNNNYNNSPYRGPHSGAAAIPGISNGPSMMNEHLRPASRPLRPETSSHGVGPNTPLNVRPAFEGCESHSNHTDHSRMVSGHQEVQTHVMGHNSHLALFPLTDTIQPMVLNIIMPSLQFKARIDNSNVELERCNRDGLECSSEDIKSTKSEALIRPQTWNYVYCQLQDNKIIIGIGANTRVMSTSRVPPEELEQAEWVVSSGGRLRGAGDGEGGPFVVQYPCAEYIAQHLQTAAPPPTTPPTPTYQPPHLRTDTPHHPSYLPPHFTDASVMGYTSEVPPTPGSHGGGNTIAVVVGVIVALLLLMLLIAIAVSIFRKRRVAKLTENTPLDDVTTKEQQKQ